LPERALLGSLTPSTWPSRLEREEVDVAIKAIVELTAKPGRRAELVALLEELVRRQGPDQPGFLGSTRFEVLEQPDVLLEIADWESADARAAHMREAAATGAYAPVLELLAEPFRVTLVQPLS